MGELDILAGIVASDGHIYKNKLAFCIVNKNLEFLEQSVIPLIQTIVNKTPEPKFVSSGFSDGKYKITVCSTKLIKILNDVYMIPAGAKSSLIKPPNILAFQQIFDYIGGWIAGDGCVTKDRTRPKIEIWSNDLVMLEWFKDVFSKCSIDSILLFEKRKKRHILRIGRKESIKTFHDKFRIPHPDKQKKLEMFVKAIS